MNEVEKHVCECCHREVQNWVHVTTLDFDTHEPTGHEYCFLCWMTEINVPDEDDEIDVEAWRPIMPVASDAGLPAGRTLQDRLAEWGGVRYDGEEVDWGNPS